MEPIYPPDGATGVPTEVVLQATVGDAEGDPRVEGRPRATVGSDFTVAVLPDTQFYACGCSGGLTDTFAAQTAWIVEQVEALDTRAVVHLGDCVQNGDDAPAEWSLAEAAMLGIEDYPLPYSIAVGNHDQSPPGNTDGTTLYNATFGATRFTPFPWYAGHQGDDNDNHAVLFDAGGVGWVVVSLEYDDTPDEAVLDWLDSTLSSHADRRAIVVTHHLIDTLGNFSYLGQSIYDVVAVHENVTLMLGGHVAGEAKRVDERGAHAVHSLLSDYQARDNGGDGWLRVLQFSPSAQAVTVVTYSPTLGSYEVDDDSQFTLSVDLSSPVWPRLGDGTTAAWTDLEPSTTYEWRLVVEADDGPTWGPTWSFTTAAAESSDPGDSGNAGDTGASADDTAAANDDAVVVSAGGCGCAAPGGPFSGWLLAGLIADWVRRRRDVPRLGTPLAC